jgi:hypothetical protein
MHLQPDNLVVKAARVAEFKSWCRHAVSGVKVTVRQGIEGLVAKAGDKFSNTNTQAQTPS